MFAWFIYKLLPIRQSFFPLIQYIGSSNQTTLGWHVDSPGRNHTRDERFRKEYNPLLTFLIYQNTSYVLKLLSY